MATLQDLQPSYERGSLPAHMPFAGQGLAHGAQSFRPGEIASVDLRSLLALLRRRLRLFVAIAIVVFAVVVAATFLSKPKYTAVAEVMLDERNERVVKSDEVLSPLPTDSNAVDTEVEVLRSRQLAERVVSALRLDKDPEFSRPAKKALAEGDMAGLRAPLPTKAHEGVVNAVVRRLGVNRSGLTNVIRVGFTSTSPAKAAAIANSFAQNYIAQQVDAKFQATHKASLWLSGRLDQLRTQVMADDAALQQFKIDNNLLSASGTTLTEQEISNYNQTLAQANTQVAEDQARLTTARQQLARGSTGDDVGETLNSPTIQKLKEQRAEVSRQVATLASQFQDAYPPLMTARQVLADVDAQISAETHRILSNLDAKVAVSRQRESAIKATLGGAQGQLATNNRAAVRLNELERNAQASRALYETYLARYKETSAQEGLEKPDAHIVSNATLPTAASSPNIPVNIGLGFMLALVAGLGGVAAAEAFQNGLRTSNDVEKRFSTRYLGALPLLRSVSKGSHLSPIDFIVAKPLSSFSEAFRSLRDTIHHCDTDRPVKVIAVTSALPGEGKTTTAICLGRAAALQGSRVLIIDCDLRRRSVEAMIKTNAPHGLLEVLSGKVELADAIVKDTKTEAHILPLTEVSVSPKDVFGNRATDRLLSAVRGMYDLVILDTAPILPVADARVLARKADFVLFVARWQATPYQAVEGALRLLAGSNVEVSGIALNQVDMMQQSRFGYGDVGYYFKQYQHYYLDAPDQGAAA